MNNWVSKTTRPKNEIFICPNCKREVMYIDSKARLKKDSRASVCGYIYCPYCLNENIDGDEKNE